MSRQAHCSTESEQAAIHRAALELRERGNDPRTIASLFLNGAAALLLDRCTEAEFLEVARGMWRTTGRQAELIDMLDRATGCSALRRGEGRRRPAARSCVRESETS